MIAEPKRKPWTLNMAGKDFAALQRLSGRRTCVVVSRALLIPTAWNRHDMAVRDSSIRPEGDCCGTDRVVDINS